MRKLIFSLLTTFFILSCGGLKAQKKDSIPPVRKYTFEVDSIQFRVIDSVLQRSHYFVGRAMNFEEADLLKSNLAAVINFFYAQKQRQDTPAIKPKK